MNNEIHFFRAGKLEVVDKDLSPDTLSWDTCLEFIDLFDPEGGWRLPTIAEFKYLYELHLKEIGRFKKRDYWTGTRYPSNVSNTIDATAVWVMDFSDGMPYYVDLNMGTSSGGFITNRVRLVRDI